MRGCALTVLLLVVSSCGGAVQDDSGPTREADSGGSIGEIDGTPFVVQSASADYRNDPGGTSWVGIGLTNQSGNECGPTRGGALALQLYVFTRGVSLVPGTYPASAAAPGSFFGDAVLHVYGASCDDPRSTEPVPDTQGTITLTSLEPRVLGSFDVVTRGAHLKGRFDALRCTNADSPSVGRLDACR